MSFLVFKSPMVFSWKKYHRWPNGKKVINVKQAFKANKTKDIIIESLRRSYYTRNQLGFHIVTLRSNCMDRIWRNAAQSHSRGRPLICMVWATLPLYRYSKSLSFFFRYKRSKFSDGQLVRSVLLNYTDIDFFLGWVSKDYSYVHVLKHSYLSSTISAEAWLCLKIEKKMSFFIIFIIFLLENNLYTHIKKKVFDFPRVFIWHEEKGADPLN